MPSRCLVIPVLAALLTLPQALLAHPQAGVRSPSPAGPNPPAFDASAFLAHVKVLSSDEFEGRTPGTKGEDLSVAYLADQFQKVGLAPGAAEGSYIQKVPLVGSTGELSPLIFRKGERRQVLRPKDDFVVWTKRVVEVASIEESDLVFVGYGVKAPEFQWDDFKGVDLAGKTLVVLINDPPVADASDPTRLDPKAFAGPAMTYYGRWTYKFEEGAARHAAAVLIVHETEAASYPFSVVQGKVGELFDLMAADKNMGRAAIEGWITEEQARALLTMAGQDFDQLKKRAATRGFQPVPLGVTATTTVRNALRPVDSRNVIGRLEGSDPALKSECVVFTAHWDHMGMTGTGGPLASRVNHGALDNATGVAGLIEMARAFAHWPVRPKRTLYFASVTAEEQGLLGSAFYTREPVCPLAKTLAVLNFEMMNPWGRTRDTIVYGLGASELDDMVRDAAAAQGRTVRADPSPASGWFYRSDHFPFARQGVPAMWIGGGDEYLGKPADFGKRMRDEYNATAYHKPTDVVKPDWDLAGAMEDLQIYFAVGARAASAPRYLAWKPGAEFRAKREAMLRQERIK